MTTFTREDFEHAARAAGYTLRFTSDFSLGLEADRVCFRVDDEYFGEWNPPDDDGDAFRLQVDCRLEVHSEDRLSGMHYTYATLAKETRDCEHTGPLHFEKHLDHGGDARKAARHAVFKAAIEIGKAMLFASDLRPNRGADAESPSVGAADQQTEHQIKGDAS